MSDAASVAATPSSQVAATLTAVPPAAAVARAPRHEVWLALQLAQPAGPVLEQLSRWALQFTPFVSPEPPDSLLAEVRSSLRLFGGAEALHAQVRAGLQQQGITACIALAPTARGALWLARAGLDSIVTHANALPGLSARLPLSCLRWPAETLLALHQLGCRHVADLIRLPRDGFARRFGPALLTELDEALGRQAMARRRYLAPERFQDRVELSAETSMTAQLEPAAALLLARLAEFLRQREASIAVVRLDLQHRGQGATRLRLALSRPTSDTGHLMKLLQARLAQQVLTAPVSALALRSGVLQPLLPQAQGLFGQRLTADPAGAARLLEQLRARLGRESVYSLQPLADHRPECGWRVAEAAGQAGPTGTWRTAQNDWRPLWLLPEPLLLANAPLQLLSGPERIESGWWDNCDVRRDYYVALILAGRRAWVYRERTPQQRWFLQGLFG